MRIILALLFAHSILANFEFVEEDFSSPRSTMNYFLKSMKGYKLGKSQGLERATKSFDLRSLSKGIKTVKAEEYSLKLINIFDKMEYVKVEKIPLKPQHSIWYYKKEVITLGEIKKSVEISLVKIKDQWKFSQNTIDSLDYYTLYLKDKKTVDGVIKDKSLRTKIKDALPAWIFNENFFLKNIQWLGLILITLISFIIDRVIRFAVAMRLLSFIKTKHESIQDFDQNKFVKALGRVVFIISFRSFLFLLELSPEILSKLHKIVDILFTVAVIISLNHAIEVLCLYLLDKARETENKFDDILVPLISKTAKFFIYAFGVIYIGDALDLNMKSILAGMGIGGIAFALAAKDTVSNLFGSFTVLLDRPFSIGDWIVINGNIEGIVEDVGLRSTRIRTFYDSIISVPNGNLTNAYIDNNGKRRYRRFSTKINLEYNTPVEKIENFCEAIRRLIINNPAIRQDTFHVYFNSMSSSSLDIMIYLFFNVPGRPEELKEIHNLLLDIMRIADELSVNFAFPTQTLHIFNEDKFSHSAQDVDFSKMTSFVEGMKNNRFQLKDHRSGAEFVK